MYLVKVTNNEDFQVGRAGHNFEPDGSAVEVAVAAFHYADLALCPYLTVELLDEDYIEPPESTEGIDMELLDPSENARPSGNNAAVENDELELVHGGEEEPDTYAGSDSGYSPSGASEDVSESHEQAEETGDGSGGVGGESSAEQE